MHYQRRVAVLFVFISIGTIGVAHGVHINRNSMHDGKLHEAVSSELKTSLRHRRHYSETGSAHIPTEYIFTCGLPPTRIDLRFQKCSNGRIESVEVIPSKTCSSRDDLLTCNGVSHCGAKQGYQCCGFETYHPKVQTCCQQSSAKYKIHDDKPERYHVCCDVRVFRRHSSLVPCEHPSFNDMFFKPKNLKSLKNNSMCNLNKHENQYFYRITVEAQKAVGERRYLEATIAVWPWDIFRRSSSKQYMLDSPTNEGSMKIPFDKYSPWKKRLLGKSFFTISDEKYLEKAVFFLNRHDNLFKWRNSGRKQRKLLKRLLRKLQNKC